MQTININPLGAEVESSKPRLMLLKFVAVGSIAILLSGGIIHLVQSRSTLAKTPTQEQPNRGDTRRKLNPPNPKPIITKKPENPIIVEEGSEAYFCLKNNGGSSCLTRERFLPNYKIISPPKPQKNYEDYLVKYGIRPSGDCGRWLNGRPHCTGGI